MIRRACLALALFATLCGAAGAPAEAAPAAGLVAVPALSGRVVDQTGTLSSATVQQLDAQLADLEARKGSQVAVLIVPTTQPEDIAAFGIRVADAWKLGRKEVRDGVILIVARNDRALRIEVGYGLEGALPDAIADRIIDEDIAPPLRRGDFDGGVRAGVERIVAVIDGEALPAPAPRLRRSPGIGNMLPVLLICRRGRQRPAARDARAIAGLARRPAASPA